MSAPERHFGGGERELVVRPDTEPVPLKPQTPACDRCTQGVMDATNDHLWGRCECECHDA